MEKKDTMCIRGEVAMIAMKIGSQWASFDYRVAQIDQNDGGVRPFQDGETVMAPVRAIVEGFHGSYAETQASAKAEMRGVVLELEVGNNTASVTENGTTRELRMPAAATVCRENLFVPLETLGDVFGLFTAAYREDGYTKDMFVLSKRDLSLFRSPLSLPPVECLLAKINGLREYVSMEVPKALYDLANISPVIQVPKRDQMTMIDPAYTGKNGELYPLPEEAIRKEGVPQGKITQYHMDDCRTYPGVQHDFWVYIPAQYDGNTPAKLLVMAAGNFFMSNEGSFDAPAILDNMIHAGTLPVTIGLFVGVGDVGSGNPAYGAQTVWDSNFSPELDSTDERYSNFVVNEVMPLALKGLNISENKYDRAIGGMSSGAPGALGAAWHHNETFGTVLSMLGSFANIRGGMVWPYALRREKKDLRVFYLSSRRDANLVFGNWYAAGKTMASALEYGGYEYVYAIGKSGHTSTWIGSLFPGMLQWAFNGTPFHHEQVELASGKYDENT